MDGKSLYIRNQTFVHTTILYASNPKFYYLKFNFTYQYYQLLGSAHADHTKKGRLILPFSYTL